MYKAKEDIGDYKKGDIVPDEKAFIWKDMYVESPVEETKQSAAEIKAEAKAARKAAEDEAKAEAKAAKETEVKAKEEQSDEEESSDDSSDALLDDYLGRNKNVVISNLKKDKLPKDTIQKLITIEKNNKNRNKVMNALKNSLEA